MKITIEHEGMKMEIPEDQVEVFKMSTPTTGQPRLILDAYLASLPLWEVAD